MNIDIGADGQFALTLPSGRILSVPNSPHAAQFIYKLLWDASHGGSDRGYIGSYPTQAIVNEWDRSERMKAARDEQAAFLRDKAQAERRAMYEALGIDASTVVIDI